VCVCVCVCVSGDGGEKLSSVYINNSHAIDDDDFYDRNLALFEVCFMDIISNLSSFSADSFFIIIKLN